MGLSVDSVPSLKAWAESLNGITYPLLSDFYPHGRVAQMYGVLRKEGHSERAIYVIDKRGIIRYVDVHDIDEAPDNEELFRVLAELEPTAPAWVRPKDQEMPPAPGADEIVLYCTSWCPGCIRARAFFKQQGIAFKEVDIGRDRQSAQLVRSWANGFESTPTFSIYGQIIVNFDEKKVLEALKRTA